jgi:cytochrome c-type biogenesis protein CcmF
LPVIAVLVFLMGVGPALPWVRASRDEMKRKLVPPAAGAVLLLALALVAGMRNAYALAVVALAGYSIVANVFEIFAGTSARRAARGEGWGLALLRSASGNRRRFGGYVAHLGVFAVAIGIAASSSMREDREASLRPGESLTVAGRTLRLKSVWGREESQRQVVGATLELVKGGRVVGTIEPRMNFYPASEQPVPTPAVRSSVFGDVYANLQAFRPDGSSVTVKVIYQPLVPWIWAGGLIVVIGAVTTILPQRRRSPVAVEARRPAAEVYAPLRGMTANSEAT